MTPDTAQRAGTPLAESAMLLATCFESLRLKWCMLMRGKDALQQLKPVAIASCKAFST